MKKEEKETNLPGYMQRGVTLLYLVIMTGIFPFFFRNRFFDITSARKDFFQAGTLMLLSCTVAFWLASLRRFRENLKSGKEVDGVDICVLLFMAVVTISSILSPCGSEAFWGNQDRQLGGAFLLLCGSAYFVVSRSYRTSGLLLWVFLLANYAAYAIMICNFFGVDVLHLKEGLKGNISFTGIMGNVNVNSEYFGVVTALMMAFLCKCKERLSKGCFWAGTVFGVYACFCTWSDSWLLAVGGGITVLLGLSLMEGSLSGWLQAVAACFCGGMGIKLTEVLDRWLGWENIHIQTLRGQSRLYVLLDWRVLLVLGSLLILAYIAGRSPWIRENTHSQYLQKWGIRALLAVVTLGGIAAVLSVLPLEDSFGSGRGYIWKRTISSYMDLPVLQKLFGYGPNCFFSFMERLYGTEMQRNHIAWVDAHNEMLQFLAVTGILGVLFYLGMQCFLLISCLRRRQEPMLAVGATGIVAFMLQALVNNPLVFTTPLYFIFLGIIQSKIRKKSE